MRLDGDKHLLGFDNMDDRAVKGTTDWKQFEFVLDVPTGAVNVLFGNLISGKGTNLGGRFYTGDRWQRNSVDQSSFARTNAD